MDELGQRLSKLSGRSSTPPLASEASQRSGQLSTPVQVSGKKTTRPPHLEEQADSGYVSVAPSPDSQKAEFAGHDLPGTKLKYFNKQIPQRLNARFFDIKVLYSQPLLEAIAKKRRNAGDIGMKLKYLGLSEQSTEPYIVIQCEKKTAKIVRKFFSQSHIEEELRPDFGVLVLDKELMRLADEDTIKVFADAAPLQTWCGVPVTLKRSAGSSVTSTLGGIVMVEEENGERMPYGLTASHALSKLRATGLPTPDASDSDTDSVASDTDSEVSAEASELSRLELTSPYEAAEAKVAVHNPDLVGYVAHNSLDDPARASQDWALVRLLNFKPLANTLLKTERSPPALELMQHSQTDSPNLDLFWNEEDSPDLTSDLDPTAVLVLTRKGSQPATLTFNTSSVLIAPGQELVQTHDISMRPTMRMYSLPCRIHHQAPSADHNILGLQPGDSGSWVVNESTGEVYGYVISIDIFGEAQVMPFGSVMLSIQEALKAVRVWLPSLGDMSVTVEEAEDMET